MTEKEKRYLGLPHHLFKDPSIFEEMAEIKDLCFKYNQVIPSNKEARNEILEEILQNKTENVNIWSPFQCFHGKNIRLGKNFFANHNLIVIDMCEVVIGDNVMFGPNVTIVTANHPKSPKEREENLEFGAKVVEYKQEKSIVEIKNKLHVGDTLEIIIPNKIDAYTFEIEKLWDYDTQKEIGEISPGVKGQKVMIKLPIKCEKDWIIRRKK